MLEKVKKETIADKIFNQIRILIEKGELKPGNKIPSERQLCEMLSVSRIAVREAIKALVAKGLLDVQSGKGTYVKSITVNDLIDPFTAILMDECTLRELLEYRCLIETEMASLAAKRATKQDIEKMDNILCIMKKNIEEGRVT